MDPFPNQYWDIPLHTGAYTSEDTQPHSEEEERSPMDGRSRYTPAFRIVEVSSTLGRVDEYQIPLFLYSDPGIETPEDSEEQEQLDDSLYISFETLSTATSDTSDNDLFELEELELELWSNYDLSHYDDRQTTVIPSEQPVVLDDSQSNSIAQGVTQNVPQSETGTLTSAFYEFLRRLSSMELLDTIFLQREDELYNYLSSESD